MNKSHTSKEHVKTLGLMSRFCMVLTKVNESDMQCDGTERHEKLLAETAFFKTILQ